MRVSPRDQILEYLGTPQREDRYDRTELDRTPLGKATTDQIAHYLACRRQLEEHLDEESVFDELCRLSLQADDETCDVFDRIHLEVPSDPQKGRLERIRAGMLADGWAEHEVRYALRDVGDRVMAPKPHPDFDLAEEPPWPGPYGEDQVISISRWEPIDLEPVLRGEQVTPPPSVFERADGVRLLYPGRLNSLMGETESCKSWIAQAVVAQELAADHHVIYADFEDGPESIVERLRALGVTSTQIAGRLTYLNPGGRLDEFAQAIVQEAISKRGAPSLAVIDGVTEAMSDIGLDPLSGVDVAAYYGGSPRWLARTGAAVALIDHVTKSQEGRGRWAIGSERKLSGLDGAAYGFESIQPFGRGKTGVVKITVAKDRCGHIRQHAGARNVIVMAELRSWPDDGVTVSFGEPEVPAGANDSFRPTHLMEEISKAIVASPGLTSRALRGAISGKSEYKDLALELLVIEGYVEVELGPNRAKLHKSKVAFRADRDGGSDDE